jgi:hypothetical protein
LKPTAYAGNTYFVSLPNNRQPELERLNCSQEVQVKFFTVNLPYSALITGCLRMIFVSVEQQVKHLTYNSLKNNFTVKKTSRYLGFPFTRSIDNYIDELEDEVHFEGRVKHIRTSEMRTIWHLLRQYLSDRFCVVNSPYLMHPSLLGQKETNDQVPLTNSRHLGQLTQLVLMPGPCRAIWPYPLWTSDGSNCYCDGAWQPPNSRPWYLEQAR